MGGGFGWFFLVCFVGCFFFKCKRVHFKVRFFWWQCGHSIEKFLLTLIGWGTDLGLKRKEAFAEKRWVWKLKSKSKCRIPVFSTYPVSTPLPSPFVGQPEGTGSMTTEVQAIVTSPTGGFIAGNLLPVWRECSLSGRTDTEDLRIRVVLGEIC